MIGQSRVFTMSMMFSVLLTNEMQPKTVACDFRACEIIFFFTELFTQIFS